MECHEIQNELSAHLDGELSPGQTRRLTAHLDSCPDCRDLFERLTAARSAFRDQAPESCPDDLRARVLASAVGRPTRPKTFDRRRIWAVPFAAAAAVAAWILLAPHDPPAPIMAIAGPGAGPEVYEPLVMAGDPAMGRDRSGGQEPFGLGQGTRPVVGSASEIAIGPGLDLY
jgi:anti-sigma factor RsiW